MKVLMKMLREAVAIVEELESALHSGDDSITAVVGGIKLRSFLNLFIIEFTDAGDLNQII